MNHTEAIETQAAERYLLGELDDAQREAFEEHFFDCPVCAMEVRDTAAFVDSAKADVRKRFGRSRTRLIRFPAYAAAATLFMFVGAQLPMLRMARSVPVVATQPETRALQEADEPHDIILGQSRAGETPGVLPSVDAQPHLAKIIAIEVPQRDARVTRAILRDARKNVVANLRISSNYLILQPLPEGRYELDIEVRFADGTSEILKQPIVVGSEVQR